MEEITHYDDLDRSRVNNSSFENTVAQNVLVTNEGMNTNPSFFDISTNSKVGYKSHRIFGFNPDIDNAYEDLWSFGGAYQYLPAGGIQMRVVSSNLNDTLLGTGARTVEVWYLDDNYVEHNIIVNMNGTTAVLTVPTNILRIQSFHVMSVGSNGSPLGNISLQNTAGTITYDYIVIGENVGTTAIFTIPAGKTGYITSWGLGSGTPLGGRYVKGLLKATVDYEDSYLPGVFQTQDILLLQDTSLCHELDSYTKCPEFTDIKVSAISDAAAADAAVAGHFEIILIDNV